LTENGDLKNVIYWVHPQLDPGLTTDDRVKKVESNTIANTNFKLDPMFTADQAKMVRRLVMFFYGIRRMGQ
jgi:hypothetical protein